MDIRLNYTMKKIYTMLIIIALAAFITGCGKRADGKAPETSETGSEPTLNNPGDYEQFKYPVEGDLCADIYILDYGHVMVKLFNDETPYACDNFATKARKGEYDGTSISQMVKDYYIQGGKPLESDAAMESIWGGGFTNEISDKLKPVRGALVMANQGRDGTNAMEFYFVTGKAETINNLDEPLRERYGMSFKDYISSKYNTELSNEELNFYYTYGGAPWVQGHNTVFGQVYEGFSVLDKLNEDIGNTDKTIYIKKITIFEHV